MERDPQNPHGNVPKVTLPVVEANDVTPRAQGRPADGPSSAGAAVTAEPAPTAPPLSEAERLVDTFIAPSKTFTDILRSRSWWLPFLLMVLVGFVFNIAVGKKVGFDQVAQQQIAKNKFAASQFDSLPPEQRAAQLQGATKRSQMLSYVSPVFVLIFALIVSLLWWATLNFVLGGQSTFGQVFTVWMYATLPKSVMYLLAALLLFANVGIDNFDVQNPLGTNPGYYMGDSSAGLKAAAGFFDIFGLWALALGVIGCAIVARKKPVQAAIAVVGWWIIGLLLSSGLAAVFS